MSWRISQMWRLIRHSYRDKSVWIVTVIVTNRCDESDVTNQMWRIRCDESDVTNQTSHPYKTSPRHVPKRGCLFTIYAAHNSKIERILVGTWHEEVLWGCDVWFVTCHVLTFHGREDGRVRSVRWLSGATAISPCSSYVLACTCESSCVVTVRLCWKEREGCLQCGRTQTGQNYVLKQIFDLVYGSKDKPRYDIFIEHGRILYFSDKQRPPSKQRTIKDEMCSIDLPVVFGCRFSSNTGEKKSWM